MKTFYKLTKDQKILAVYAASLEIIELVAHGTIEITLRNPDSQSKLESILSESRQKESPRLAILKVLNNEPIRKEIVRVAIVVACESKYSKDGFFIKEVDQNEIDKHFASATPGRAGSH